MSEESGVELSATSFKVHANEQISTGDYENYSAHATIEGVVSAPSEIKEAGSDQPVASINLGENAADLSPEVRKELKARLLAVHKDLQAVVGRACENRVKADGHEDWGVHNGDGGSDE